MPSRARPRRHPHVHPRPSPTKETPRQRITPSLWFDGRAEEAADLYTSIVPTWRIWGIDRYRDAGPGPKGAAMAVTFQLEGQEFMALSGGPPFTVSPAISFFVSCTTQPEVDELWDRLSEGGEANRCGWLRDKFGVSWQIVPAALGERLHDPDPDRANRVMTAMLQMGTIDIAGWRVAYRH
ncbi:MAG TPA: VOC family protein [Candidatus Micrarchaeia archaeon]|nr:VOC family protein [Candidatus Micrarchaeia archaeon]